MDMDISSSDDYPQAGFGNFGSHDTFDAMLSGFNLRAHLHRLRKL